MSGTGAGPIASTVLVPGSTCVRPLITVRKPQYQLELQAKKQARTRL